MASSAYHPPSVLPIKKPKGPPVPKPPANVAKRKAITKGKSVSTKAIKHPKAK